MNRITRAGKALKAVGWNRSFHYAEYNLKLRSGAFRAPMRGAEADHGRFVPLPLLPYKTQSALRGVLAERAGAIHDAAELALRGRFNPYFGPTQWQLDFTRPHAELHWSCIRIPETEDVKDIWEPARFCWAGALCQAALLEPDEKYRSCFEQHLAQFARTNPLNYGENWLSAQECAIRLIWIALAESTFHAIHEDLEFASKLPIAQLIGDHANRILQTRAYAVAQNNNHWLSESAGLMTAAVVLPDSPFAAEWFERGWSDFQTALPRQIALDGAYVQQSANYHRLMLQLVLWVDLLLSTRKLEWQAPLAEKIRRSILWLAKQTDAGSGAANALGHNDGALLFPLGGDFADYRPTLQAAARVFLGEELFPSGPWDALALWLNAAKAAPQSVDAAFARSYLSETVLRIHAEDGWASLRVAGYRDRPAHADQLQVSIWHRGKCCALDAGTFRYSAQPPWQNALKSAFVHNCPTVDGLEPMSDAGKFLWLNWDQARILEQNEHSAMAEHTGYLKLGIQQIRRLERIENGWKIVDELRSFQKPTGTKRQVRLHWLLPEQEFVLKSDNGAPILETAAYSLQFFSDTAPLQCLVICAGKQVYPEHKFIDNWQPICGWVSPTYGQLQPALSLIVTAASELPCRLTTIWRFKRAGG